MGADPAESVCDSYGQTHDHENLFVVGSPTLPNAGCTNGTLTFVALTLRSAEKLLLNYPNMLRKTICWMAALAGSVLAQNVEWPVFGGDQAGTKYSTLTQINRDNVRNLKLAWEWKAGEKPLEQFHTFPGVFEVTPLMVDGTLYLSTPYNRVIALDPTTGKERWSYDPKAYEDGQVPNGTGFVHRGVAFWRDGATIAVAS